MDARHRWDGTANASDTVRLRVNGQPVPLDQANLTRIDIGPYLQAGDNSLEVIVAGRMLNATKASGAPGFAAALTDDYGLMGPVLTTAYRQTIVRAAVPARSPSSSTFAG